MKVGTAVLLTTSHNRVFFGYLAEDSDGKTTLSIDKAQMVTYWSSAMKGVYGLASKGPNSECRVGEPVENIEIFGITTIAKCSEQAVQKFGEMPWR